MKYAVCTPIAVFCCENNRTPEGLVKWLDVGSAITKGIYANTHRIYDLLHQCGGIWTTDSVVDLLPNGQTPFTWAEHIINIIDFNKGESK